MKEVRVGVVGLGRFGRLHARILSELPGCRVGALCETDEPTLERCGEEYGVGALYTDLEAMLGSEGLLVEPGAAVAVAAHRKLAAQEVIREAETAVIVLTGHGLKDSDALRFTVGTTDEATVVDPGDVEALGATLEAHG